MENSIKTRVLAQLSELRTHQICLLEEQPKDSEAKEMLRIIQKEMREIKAMTTAQFLPVYRRYYAHVVALLLMLFSLTATAQSDTTYAVPELPYFMRTMLSYGIEKKAFKFEVWKEEEMKYHGLIRGISISFVVKEPGTYEVKLLHPENPAEFNVTATEYDDCEGGHYISIKTGN